MSPLASISFQELYLFPKSLLYWPSGGGAQRTPRESSSKCEYTGQPGLRSPSTYIEREHRLVVPSLTFVSQMLQTEPITMMSPAVQGLDVHF